MPTTRNAVSGTMNDQNALAGALSTAAQKVVIINGSGEILELLESVLDAGRYDIVFVESNEHGYSQIKRVQPNLVILCMELDDLHSFQVLSMLKLDDETREIPVLTYATNIAGVPSEFEKYEPSGNAMFAAKSALRMN